jgi:hypothetical protein
LRSGNTCYYLVQNQQKKWERWKRETIFNYETCKMKPGLRHGHCFKKYYTQQNYKQK